MDPILRQAMTLALHDVFTGSDIDRNCIPDIGSRLMDQLTTAAIYVATDHKDKLT